MLAFHILGIIWAIKCCYATFGGFRASKALLPADHAAEPVKFIVRHIILFVSFAYLGGIVASKFLFDGAVWSIGYIGVLAIYEGYSDTLVLLKCHHFAFRTKIKLIMSSMFSFTSLVFFIVNLIELI